MIDQEMASNCASTGVDWVSRRISSKKGWSGSGTGCAGKGWICYPWRYLRDVWKWHLGAWVSGGLVLG